MSFLGAIVAQSQAPAVTEQSDRPTWWDVVISGRKVAARKDPAATAVVRKDRFRFGFTVPQWVIRGVIRLFWAALLALCSTQWWGQALIKWLLRVAQIGGF